MEFDKISNLSDDELKVQAAQAGEQLFRIRFQKTLGNTEGLKKLRTLKLDVARIRHDLVTGVHHVIELLAHRGDHARMAMADVIDRDAAREVDVAATLDVPQLGILGRWEDTGAV